MSLDELDPDEEQSLRARLRGAVPAPPATPDRGIRAARAGKKRRLTVVAASVAASAAVIAVVLALALGGSTGENTMVTGGQTSGSGPTGPRLTSPAASTSPPATRKTPGQPRFDHPPPVTVDYGTESIDLDAYGYCYGNVCADGFPPERPPSVGSPGEVLIDFPLDDWSFEATFQPAGQRCGRMQTVHLERNGDGAFALTPAGYADTYDVTLFGRGEGDLVTVFRWTTPFDGPLPEPAARLALVSGDPGDVSSYGVELEVSNLAATPERASAVVTVTAANGESVSFEAVRDPGCHPEGTVYWDGPDAGGRAAADLGQPPFTYEVTLSLDGERYTAVAHWPADEIKGNEPSVALVFEPRLPALSPR